MRTGTATNEAPRRAQPAAAGTQSLCLGPVLLLGAPGAGKGTQAQLLMKRFKVPQISTGDILRTNIADGSELGRTAKALMDQGVLVPDDVVNRMVALRLRGDDLRNGYILDGFPRTLAQADWLDTEALNSSSLPPLVAISIHVPKEELLRRVTGRRVCPSCKRIYNMYSHPPRTNGFCDIDGTPLAHRSDDTESAFQERIRAYEALTAPVVHHYQVKGTFREIDGTGSLEEIEQRLLSALSELREDDPGSGVFSSPTGSSS